MLHYNSQKLLYNSHCMFENEWNIFTLKYLLWQLIFKFCFCEKHWIYLLIHFLIWILLMWTSLNFNKIYLLGFVISLCIQHIFDANIWLWNDKFLYTDTFFCLLKLPDFFQRLIYWMKRSGEIWEFNNQWDGFTIWYMDLVCFFHLLYIFNIFNLYEYLCVTDLSINC